MNNINKDLDHDDVALDIMKGEHKKPEVLALNHRG
jgi:hypothetical protein